MQYYFSIDGTAQQGPVDRDGLRAAGCGPETMVWREGLPEWQPARLVPELAGFFPAGPGPTPVAPPPSAAFPPASSRPQNFPQGGPPLNYSPPGQDLGTNGMAIASLVCGLIGVVTACCFVPSILAIVFGYNARSQIARGHGTGRGLATAGIVLGWVAILLAFLGFAFRINHGHVYMNGRPVGI